MRVVMNANQPWRANALEMQLKTHQLQLALPSASFPSLKCVPQALCVCYLHMHQPQL